MEIVYELPVYNTQHWQRNHCL